MSHDGSRWVEFNVHEQPRRYEAFLLLDWRPTVKNQDDIVPFARLLAIRAGLAEGSDALRDLLIDRVQIAHA